MVAIGVIMLMSPLKLIQELVIRHAAALLAPLVFQTGATVMCVGKIAAPVDKYLNCAYTRQTFVCTYAVFYLKYTVPKAKL
jgi:hypothetical protein